MDSTLQKRLIGAIILIVAAIVFVPMLLDGPGQAGTETVDLGIPAPGPDGMRTEVIPLDAPIPTPPLADEGDVAPIADDNLPTAATTEPPLVASDPTTLSDPIDPAPVVDSPPPIDIAPIAITPSEHTADTSGRWHVTLGSYANADNAQKLVADMRHAGLPARAEPVTLAGKPALRVRIGPYADRVRAEAARLAVAAKRRDVTPALVQDEGSERAQTTTDAAPVSATDAVVPAAAADPGVTPAPNAPVMRDARGWVVQTGAFAQLSEADAQVAKFRAAGFTAFVDRLDAPRGVLHRVRIGPEAERAGADRLQAQIKQSLSVDGVVMRHP